MVQEHPTLYHIMSVSEIKRIFKALSEAYADEGDEGRAASFARAADVISCLKNIKSGADIANLQGIGKSCVDIVDEYLKTGRCERLEEMCSIDDKIRMREEELKHMTKPKTKEITKAFVLTNHPYVKERAKEAKDVIKSMDVHLRVIVADMLHKDGYVPFDDNELCEYCHTVLDETCSDECTCDQLRAEAIGCTF